MSFVSSRDSEQKIMKKVSRRRIWGSGRQVDQVSPYTREILTRPNNIVWESGD